MNPAWIRQQVDGVRFVAPNGAAFDYFQTNSGLIINRALMHGELAAMCREGGIRCLFNTSVKTLSGLKNLRRTALLGGENTEELRARIVIDASGPGKGFGRDEKVTQGNFDLEPACFALVEGLTFPQNLIQLFFGQCYAPGGYGWLFPRENNVANIGVVIGKAFVAANPIRKLCLNFIARQFPQGRIVSLKGGAIPCGQSSGAMAVSGLIKTGDAANMVNPISRSGILEAMHGGRLAADAALQALTLETEKQRSKVYRDYQRIWNQHFGRNHLRIHRAKAGFASLNDGHLNKAANRIAKIPAHKRSMTKIFLATLLANPLLLWYMRGMIK
jgi:digeranylgeranylglycerophospholipid reductase